jgi:hypothetical protein
VLLWVTFLSAPVRLVTGVVDAAAGLRRAERALAQGLVKAARYDTLASSAAVARARAGLEQPSPLSALARMDPRVEAAYGEVGELVAALEHSAAAAQGTLTLAQDALRGPDKLVVRGSKASGTGSLVRIARIRAVARLLAGVRRELRAAASELRAVRVAALPRRAGPQIARALARAEDSDELLGDALAGLRILPAVLGADGPRRYLVGIQNSAELRGTGGAMLRFAVIAADRGRLDLERSTSPCPRTRGTSPASRTLNASGTPTGHRTGRCRRTSRWITCGRAPPVSTRAPRSEGSTASSGWIP